MPRLVGLRRAVRNATELLRRGRLSAPVPSAWDEVATGPHHRLRRYRRRLDGPMADVPEPLLLVPPLMVAADVYDISPELSSARFLSELGLDVWLVDFGAPEQVDGGMARTLDDHVIAVDAAIDAAHAHTGEPVHLAGYSQGGMFCYQAAAYRRAADLGSVITFGSPVDLRRALPVVVRDPVMERLVRAVRHGIEGPLSELDGLPGLVTSTGFKLFSARKEVEQVAQFVRLLPDRDALVKREPTRRFLGGEGFVAWPGPAFRDFVDRVIVENRMTSGGLVIGGRAVALADITCPVLYFVGSRDEMARGPAVRGIRRAAPNAELHEVVVPAGHFGLVVGSRALRVTWPTVAEWVAWRAGRGEPPRALDAPVDEPRAERPTTAGSLYQSSIEIIDKLWDRLGDVSEEVGGLVDALRWQIPRLARLESLRDRSRVSLGRVLADQAAAIPDEPVFLWQGRAWDYGAVDARVDALAALLHRHDVGRGTHVGVWMDQQPDLLALLGAISRLGAVGVPLDPATDLEWIGHAVRAAAVQVLVVDVAHEDVARSLDVDVVVHRAGDIEGPSLPADVPRNDGRAEDLAMLLLSSTEPRAVPVRMTNRRLAMAGLATAGIARLTPSDTVYCCLPVWTAFGLLVAVGGALVGGSRLALAPRFDLPTFWDEVRRVGATVVVYDTAMCEALCGAPTQPNERSHPARLFVGRGMDASLHRTFRERFGRVQIVELYASTVGNVAMAELEGSKPGSVGRPLMPGMKLALVRVDAHGQLVRGATGWLARCRIDEPGVLLVRIDASHPMARFDGYLDPQASEARVVRGAFAPGDAWFHTGDVLRRDADGDYWFVSRGAARSPADSRS